MNKFLKQGRTFLFGLTIGVISVFSLSFDNYAELSKHLEIFGTLFKELNIYYVDEIHPGELTKKGIEAMLEDLDPYTNYISEEDVEDHRMNTTGLYGGIGAVIRKKGDYVVIAEPYENAPAQKAGLMAGDMIMEINGNSTKSKTTDDVVKLLRGAPNTNAVLTIQREGEGSTRKVEITRTEIKIENVPYYGMLDAHTGYIKLRGFTNNAGKDVADALIQLKKNEGLQSLVLDLRGNPGGLLREAINVVNVFVDKNQLVVSTKGKVAEWNKVYKTLNAATDTEIPLVVLVDGGSASASEIVSGTIQDLDRGVVIGQRTFGKGLVQTTRSLVYNTQLKLTTSKYYIPSGRCIQEVDYSKKDDKGKAKSIPDSLRSKFKTKVGRTVYDGGGIFPDISMKPRKYSNIVRSLISKNLIFDFATQYRASHPTLASAKDFRVTDELYQEFVNFLQGKDYDYTTESEKALQKFKETAQKEKYFEEVETEYNLLLNKKKQSKEADLEKYKSEISEFLGEEIVSRYYYQKGRLENSLQSDQEILEAIRVLNGAGTYSQVLNASYQIKLVEYDRMNDEEVELLLEGE